MSKVKDTLKGRMLIKLNPDSDNQDPKTPVLILSMRAYKKMVLWTKFAADLKSWEVSGLGSVYPRFNGYYVSDVWLIKPERVSTGIVNMDPKAIGALMRKLYMGTGEMRSDGVAFKGGRSLQNLRFMWHSHVNFDVFWSGTDDHTARNVFCSDAKWTINLVMNAKGKLLARQDFPASKKEPVHNLPIRLLVPMEARFAKKNKQYYLDLHEDFLNSGEELISEQELEARRRTTAKPLPEVETAQNEDLLSSCPECDSPVRGLPNFCPNCGCAFQDFDDVEMEGSDSEDPQQEFWDRNQGWGKSSEDDSDFEMESVGIPGLVSEPVTAEDFNLESTISSIPVELKVKLTPVTPEVKHPEPEPAFNQAVAEQLPAQELGIAPLEYTVLEKDPELEYKEWKIEKTKGSWTERLRYYLTGK